MEFDHLIKRLSPDCRDLFEQALAAAASRGHFQLEIEHVLRQALAERSADIVTVLRHFCLDIERIDAGLLLALDALKTGNGGFPRIGPDVARTLFEAWMVASSQCRSLEIRPAHLLLALVGNDTLRLRLHRISPELTKLMADDLQAQCAGLLRAPSVEAFALPHGTSGCPALDQFTIDLTAQARDGQLDPVLGRDTEIRQLIDVLCRRRQNNPILTGEAGVGKTAVVEGLALRIADGSVPDSLKGVSLRTLDMGLLQAGAGVKGEFENRLKTVIQEVQRSVQPVVIFIDEAHTLIGAGNQAGAGDAANMLKPALARGELRTIAATTWAEYKKYFESDAALTRRFQVVKVDEPSEAQATVMLRSLVETLASHHDVTILDEAVVAAVHLSHRYIAGRQLPDKCVSLLDTACARVNLSQRAIPPALERCNYAVAAIEAELAALERDRWIDSSCARRMAELRNSHADLLAEQADIELRWIEARRVAAQIGALRAELQTHDMRRDALPDVGVQLAEARERMAQLQAASPLLHDCVDRDVVAAVVADWTGIPIGRMQQNEIDDVLALQRHLEQRVVGQRHALEAIASSMRTARARLNDPHRPLGVFLLAGPSGVGKTETALALAEQLYGSERSITVINMSEFKEEHKVSLLMGSPPGYVGYGEGGILTEAVRRKPYSVVLLDEVEKAHPGVQDIFYQVFDKGVLRDGEGRDIDFRNTVIVLTSNAASDLIETLCADPDTRPDPSALIDALAETLRRTFKPALLGRLSIIPYYPLDEIALATIARMQLDVIAERMHSAYGVRLGYGEPLVQHIIDQCRHADTGARQVSAMLSKTLLPALAEQILMHVATGDTIGGITAGLDGHGGLSVRVEPPSHDATSGADPMASPFAEA